MYSDRTPGTTQFKYCATMSDNLLVVERQMQKMGTIGGVSLFREKYKLYAIMLQMTLGSMCSLMVNSLSMFLSEQKDFP